MPMVYIKVTSYIVRSCMYDLQVCFLLTAMLIYRTQRNVRKRRLKLTHAGIMLFIVFLTVIALVAVFDSHNLASPPLPNMYSLHSWVGLTTVILFCCQVNLQNLLDNLQIHMSILFVYSGSPDVSLSSFLGCKLHYELLICQYMYTLALQPLWVQLLRVCQDSMKKRSSYQGQ